MEMFPELMAAPIIRAKSRRLLPYPGSKGWFIPTLLKNLQGCRHNLIEPFAGSAVCGLAALESNSIDELVLVEKNTRLAHFWKTVFTDDTFAERVLAFPLKFDGPTKEVERHGKKFRIIAADEENRARVLAAVDNQNDIALGVLLAANASFNGLSSSKNVSLTGAGWPIETSCMRHTCVQQKGTYMGVASTLNLPFFAQRIRQYRALHSRVSVIQGDGLVALLSFPNHFAFVDPPYVAAGAGFYVDMQIDHAALLNALAARPAPWLATYDVHPLIMELVKKLGLAAAERSVRTVSNTHKPELIIAPSPEYLSSLAVL